MPWSGGAFTRTNGVHTGSTLWVQDRDAGTKILATRHDTHDQDLADGINATLEKSGSNAATGNLDIGSNRLTLVADGTAKTDAATVNQIQSNGPAFQATDTGTANAYVIALSPAVTAYAAGQAITFKAGAASTTASTLNVNTLGTKAIKKLNDQDIASGDIESGSIVTVVYDGTSFQMTSQLASTSTTSPGGSNTQVQYNSSGSFAGSANFTFDGTSATLANPVFLPDGSSSAPALSNTGDTNSGVYFPAADTVGIVTAGAEKWRFGSNPLAGRNHIINGEFAIAQRGTSFTATDSANDDDTYNLDRWVLISDGDDIVDVTQTTTVPTAGALKSIGLDVETGNKQFGIVQIIEASNCSGLIGNEVTLSFKAKVSNAALGDVRAGIIAWSSTADAVTSDVIATYNADANPTLASNLTFENTPADLSVTTSWATYSVTGTIDTSSTANVVVWIGSVDSATTAGHFLYITDVQLEVGGVATAFERNDRATSLVKCQRYFERRIYTDAADTIGSGVYTTGTVSTIILYWSTKRTQPTVTFEAASNYRMIDKTNSVFVASGIAGGAICDTTMTINMTTSAATTGGAYGTCVNADTHIDISAEM
jgi:hypothetical protein